jgi:branched-chain amino acid transport system permease protein
LDSDNEQQRRMVVVEQLINGLSLGAIYALVAVGLAMVFGVLEIVNFAHGEFFMIASYLFFTLYVTAQLPYAAAGLLTVLVMAVFGAVFELLIIRPVVHRPWQTQLVVTLGASVLFVNAAVVIFGTFPQRAPTPLVAQLVTVGGIQISAQRLLLFALTVLAFVVLQLFVRNAKLGKAMRAVSQNREACAAMGINVQHVAIATFAIGSALVGLAGALAAPLSNITPTMGTLLTIKAFAAVIMGGFGRVSGTIIAAFILGIAEAFAIQYISSGYVDAIAFLIMIATLLFRPYGLFGRTVGI